ncbi:hypothetical protein [Natronorubrum texcoconense]|uniref:hypothetical protein n=1 Tax=Natronorubrum texcoconense TaxID=1095776 RepID=UPI0011137DB2|nr:hypothetical protein [Natronorubrum texcoconense]
MSDNSDVNRRAMLKSIGASSAGLALVSTAKADEVDSDNYMPCCGGGSGSSPNEEWEFESDHT